MRTVYLHCGLHKTGTTAIQTACDEGRETLRAHGVLYPPTHPLYPGHHNLAWQIGRDHRFDPQGPTIDSVVAEIAAFDGDALLSSEDFESVLHRPRALLPLIEAIQRIPRQVSIIVYFRDSTAYAESLYLELLKQGYPETFRRFAREIRTTSRLSWRDWTFQFDYQRVAAGLAALPGVAVQQRCYREAAVHSSVTHDLLAAIGRPADLLGDLACRRQNERDPPATSLAAFCGHQFRRPLRAAESDAIERLCTLAGPLPAGPGRLDRMDRVYSARTAGAVSRIARLGAVPAAAAAAARLVSWWQAAPAPRTWPRRLLDATLQRLGAAAKSAVD
jgi:hypothetical protein